METHVFSAYDRTEIAKIEQLDWSQVEAALARAQNIHRSADQKIPRWKRIEILEIAASKILARKAELAHQIALEGGKPLVDALVEVERAANSTKLAASLLISERGDEIPLGITPAGEGRIAFTRRKPIGPVVAVSAFNHPLNLIAHQVAPAIAANCPVIIKPSMLTPLSCLAYVDILREAGLPSERCFVALCDRETSERMVRDPRTAFFSFIGSAKVGWYLRSKLAPGTRCALEHGGVAPVIVDSEVDQEEAINSICKGAFYHAGQVCVSVQRLFVVGEQADNFIEALVAKAKTLNVGDPTQSETEVGPLIADAEVDRVSDWVTQAIAEGADCRCGGRKLSETLYEPTVLVDPPYNSNVAQREVFGPVVCVFRCRSLEEAVERANSVDASFQAAVFTRNINTAMRTADALNGSAVMVNDHTAFRVDWMPFAGLGTSGLGVGGIKGSFEDMTYGKMTVIRT